MSAFNSRALHHTHLMIIQTFANSWKVHLDIDTCPLENLRASYTTTLQYARGTQRPATQNNLPAGSYCSCILSFLLAGVHFDAHRLSFLNDDPPNGGIG
jgi:hypothetical protein